MDILQHFEQEKPQLRRLLEAEPGREPTLRVTRDYLTSLHRELAKVRIAIEHVNRRCKIFRIVKETYRGKHTNYQKTWTVVAALVNLRYDQNARKQGV